MVEGIGGMTTFLRYVGEESVSKGGGIPTGSVERWVKCDMRLCSKEGAVGKGFVHAGSAHTHSCFNRDCLEKFVASILNDAAKTVVKTRVTKSVTFKKK